MIVLGFVASAGIMRASIISYQSLIAFHLGLQGVIYGILIFFSSIVSVCVAVNAGYFADIIRRKFMPIGMAGLIGGVGFLWVALDRTPLSFVISTLFFGSTASVIFQQALALYKQVVIIDGIRPNMANSLARSLYSLSWVVTPPLVARLVSRQGDMFSSYLVASGAGLFAFVLFLFSLQGVVLNERFSSLKQDISYRDSMLALRRKSVLLKVTAVGLVTGSLRLDALILGPIVIYHLHGSISDVGFIVGIESAFEIPSTLIWGILADRWGSSTTIFIASVIYSAYFIVLARISNFGEIYGVVALGSFGASGLLTVTISYLQSILKEQVGFSTSLTAISNFLGWTMAAVIIGLVTTSKEFGQAAIIASLLSLLGGTIVFLPIHRRRGSHFTP
ncbi:MFS transporter [Acidisoma sp. 7E03]